MSSGMGLLKSARLTRRQLIVFALASAILNGIVTACVGAWLAQTYAAQQSRRQSVETIARLIYDRRTRAGMVVSSLRRNAPAEEIQFRKRAYDEAYVDWNKNILLNLFVIREVGGEMKFAALEQMFQDDLVGAMADVDRCLTTAYDRKLAGENPAPILEACQMATLHQFVLDCGATFTDELYKLTQLSFSPFSGERQERKRLAEANIKANCTRTLPAGPLTAVDGARVASGRSRISAPAPGAAARRAACARLSRTWSSVNGLEITPTCGPDRSLARSSWSAKPDMSRTRTPGCSGKACSASAMPSIIGISTSVTSRSNCGRPPSAGRAPRCRPA